jgi:hypothetical protein
MGINHNSSFSYTVYAMCMRKKWVLTTGVDDRELGPYRHNTTTISYITDWPVYCLDT